jgi:hypothetical protein
MCSEFACRTPTLSEQEKIRLILSIYQDGTGQLARGKSTLPGWRDFERSVAVAFDGIAQESKAIFDVLVPISDDAKINYGISCKMRNQLKSIEKNGRVTTEVSNSLKKFQDALKAVGMNDYHDNPEAAGKTIINLVESWHNAVSIDNEGNVDLTKSFYLVLQWNEKSGNYQLYQLPLALPNPETLSWSTSGKRLIGKDDKGIIIEWYGESGGQLKYYPFADKAIWVSKVFKLEPLPESDIDYGLLRRVREYFPELWEQANNIP